MRTGSRAAHGSVRRCVGRRRAPAAVAVLSIRPTRSVCSICPVSFGGVGVRRGHVRVDGGQWHQLVGFQQPSVSEAFVRCGNHRQLLPSHAATTPAGPPSGTAGPPSGISGSGTSRPPSGIALLLVAAEQSDTRVEQCASASGFGRVVGREPVGTNIGTLGEDLRYLRCALCV